MSTHEAQAATETEAAEAGMSEDERTVREAVARLTGSLAPNRVERAEPGASLVDDLGYDSLRLVELVLWLEELFETGSGAVDEVQGIETVADLQRFALEAVAEGRAVVPAQSALATAIGRG